MQIDILADTSDMSKSPYQYHQRFYISTNDIAFNADRKTLQITAPLIMDNQVLEFVAVTPVSLLTNGIRFRGLAVPVSGTGNAPVSRIIDVQF